MKGGCCRGAQLEGLERGRPDPGIPEQGIPLMCNEEIIGCIQRKGFKAAVREVDVLPTATSRVMCS